MKLLFLENFCTHFTRRLFEEIGYQIPTRFLFFSGGTEKYWEKANQMHAGDFEHRYLPGYQILPKTRFSPALISEVLQSKADAIVMALSGRFALPCTFLLAKIKGKPFILWTGLWYHPESFFHKISWPLTRFIYHHSDAILTYGSHVKDYLVKNGVEPEKIFNFWHSCDTEKMGRKPDAKLREKYQSKWSPNKKPIVLYVGRLDPVKSLDTLVAASALLTKEIPHQLVLVGRGPEKETLRAQAKKLNHPVIFEDYIQNNELPEVYASSEVFVLPSKTLPTVKEAWGIVLNEAMLQGCIPVASNAVGAAVGGLFDKSLQDLVFEEQSVSGLKEALMKAIRISKEASEKEKVRQQALKFNPKNQVKVLKEVLEFLNIPTSE